MFEELFSNIFYSEKLGNQDWIRKEEEHRAMESWRWRSEATAETEMEPKVNKPGQRQERVLSRSDERGGKEEGDTRADKEQTKKARESQRVV